MNNPFFETIAHSLMRRAYWYPWARQGLLNGGIFSIRSPADRGGWELRVGLKNNCDDFRISDMTWIVYSFNWCEKIPRGLADYRYHVERWRFESFSSPVGVDPARAKDAMALWCMVANANINFGDEPEYDPTRHFPQRLIVKDGALKLLGHRLWWGPGSRLPGLDWENDTPIPARS